jgi:hypothetical protein
MQESASLPELQKLLGHATLVMTVRYAHLAPKHLRAAVSRLDGVLQGASREQAGSKQGASSGDARPREVAAS